MNLLQRLVSEEICSKNTGTKFWTLGSKRNEKKKFFFSVAQGTWQVKSGDTR